MELPGGTVTFLFTDVEGSTRQWDAYPEAMGVALRQHDSLMREAIEGNGGFVFKTVGDGFCAVFPSALHALAATLAAQRALMSEAWPEPVQVRVRMALHTGLAEERDGDYFGPTLNRVARLLSLGYGGQILLSQATRFLVYNTLPADVSLQDMGQHRLKDLLAPEQVWQLCHPELPADFLPLKSLSYLPTNLPRQITSFIGRDHEMAEVKSLLKSAALVTLTGTGGTGKTRLALQVGAEVLEQYRDGCWLVELAAIADPTLITQAVATVLHLREEAGHPLLQTVENHLRDRQLLLILDNCEHIVSGCAHVCGTLLKSCPHLTILATSREPLGVGGERTWRTPSLLTPDPDTLLHEQNDQTGVMMRYDAPRLFVERAMTHRQDFVLRDGDAFLVSHLCRQLDGIPLAIELAAARVRSLSVAEICARLDNRFRLLTGGSRAALPRHQTLRALIDWSYDLLNTQEKLLLHRLSVFAGGWTLAAAEQVITGESIEDWEVVDLLTSLVDKSLVVYEEREGGPRYRLLETVRQYAQDRLVESGESDTVRERHRNHFLALAESAETKLKGVEQTQWLQLLEEEHDNLRAALDWSLSEPVPTQGLRLCAALPVFWWTRGYLSEGRKWCARALGNSGVPEPTPERRKVLNGVGTLAWMQGDYVAARTYYEENLGYCREIEDRNGIAGSLNGLGIVASFQGDHVSARAYHEENLVYFRQIGDRNGIASALNNLGIVAFDQGDYASAQAYHQESLTLRREIGDRSSIANSLNNLGNVARIQSDDASAQTYHEESLTLFREIGDRRGVANALNNLGMVNFDQGDYASAQASYNESLAIKREIGDRGGVANSLLNLGKVARSQEDYVSARTYHEESLALFWKIGNRSGAAYSLEEFAKLAVQQSYFERAIVLRGAVETLREAIGLPLPPNEREEYDRRMTGLRQALGEEAFAVVRATGRAMTLAQAIEYALTDAGWKQERTSEGR